MLHRTKNTGRIQPRETAGLTLSKPKIDMDRCPNRRQPFVSAGLRDREGQIEKRTLRQKQQQRENTQRGFVRQHSNMRLDPPADQQCSDEAGPVAGYMAQWRLEGGTFWESW